MWPIRLKGVKDTLKILPYNETGNLGMGSNGQIPLYFFESVEICDGAPSNVF